MKCLVMVIGALILMTIAHGRSTKSRGRCFSRDENGGRTGYGRKDGRKGEPLTVNHTRYLNVVLPSSPVGLFLSKFNKLHNTSSISSSPQPGYGAIAKANDSGMVFGIWGSTSPGPKQPIRASRNLRNSGRISIAQTMELTCRRRTQLWSPKTKVRARSFPVLVPPWPIAQISYKRSGPVYLP
jgi:hypothetical protein